MKFLDLTVQYKTIKQEVDTAIQRVLDSGIFIGGKEVEELEAEVAKFCGTKYAISVNSGTDALFLSLRALGITQGDEVITTPFSFIATASVIAHAGATPVFADIDPVTFTIDPRKIEERITTKTKAIIPVHLFGQAADMNGIMKIAKAHKLAVIEDAAQAIGSTYKKRKAGSMGNVGCFSFFPTKNLGAYGDAGMVTTNDKNMAEKITFLKSHGSSQKEKYINVILGTNSRLDAMQAAILQVKLKYLAKWNAKRLQHALYYNKLFQKLHDVLAIPSIPSHALHTFHQYTIRVKKPDALKAFLAKKIIPTMRYYPLGLHMQPVFTSLGYKRGDFPETEKACKEVLSLPIYPELSAKEQDYVGEAIKQFFS